MTTLPEFQSPPRPQPERVLCGAMFHVERIGHMEHPIHGLYVRCLSTAGHVGAHRTHIFKRPLGVEDAWLDEQTGGDGVCWCDGPDCGQTPCVEDADLASRRQRDHESEDSEGVRDE